MHNDRTLNGRRDQPDTIWHNLSPEGTRRFEALQNEFPIMRHLRFVAYVGADVPENDMLEAFEQMARGAQARTRPATRRPRG